MNNRNNHLRPKNSRFAVTPFRSVVYVSDLDLFIWRVARILPPSWQNSWLELMSRVWLQWDRWTCERLFISARKWARELEIDYDTLRKLEEEGPWQQQRDWRNGDIPLDMLFFALFPSLDGDRRASRYYWRRFIPVWLIPNMTSLKINQFMMAALYFMLIRDLHVQSLEDARNYVFIGTIVQRASR